MTVHFCTLFDARYAARGLVMLESLEAQFAGDKTVTILAMDDEVPSMVARMGRPNWKVVTVEDIGDAELVEVKTTRPHREFCWTCAPALMSHMVQAQADNEIVAYLDADLYFFSSPQLLLDELGSSGTILIHEHRYSEDRRHYESSSGRFNVGFLAFLVGDEARACVNRWRQQVLDKCVLEPENGYCGDQGYLNEWPSLYPGLRILKNIGGGVAPWNLLAYKVEGTASRPTVSGVPVVFFHYHSFRMVSVGAFSHVAAIPAWGYDFSRESQRLLFSRYARKIRGVLKRAGRLGFTAESDLQHPVREAVRALLRRNLISAI
ncbi:hypothetical protein MTR72_39055 [Bradyrhizobium sp. ISRA442]|uniref:hypothetical protein n=1 Tax=Bradyrhizobium sp. ISRA442 TaxID=2866197 RepID=UPI00311B1FC7